jgi:putative transcriptional regulator
MTRCVITFLLLLASVGSGWGDTPALPQQATSLVLVATPRLQDALFGESVVLVTRHGRSRPMGVILNKPATDAPPTGTARPGQPLFRGGPVAPRNLVSLFRQDGEAGRNLLDLGGNLYIGFGHALLEKLLNQEPAPEQLKVFVGFSVWEHGQLEKEISRGDWWVVPFDADVAFRKDTTNLWRELTAKASRKDI